MTCGERRHWRHRSTAVEVEHWERRVEYLSQEALALKREGADDDAAIYEKGNPVRRRNGATFPT
jgi:hypothetical protein